MRAIAAVVALTATSAVNAGRELPAPMTVNELRRAEFETELVYERQLDAGPGFTAYLVAYEHSGLKLHAMVAVPSLPRPDDGYPVVIANHGYVPNPRRYGITSEGVDSRPGDYYRAVPQMFASRGFLTVIPDYRGHNNSDGFEYIDPQDALSAKYYAEDVVALLPAIDQIEYADAENVFMWSHSMGGSVSMRTLLASDVVRASSFWSTMNVDEYSDRFDELDGPVNVQHAIADKTTPYSNSETLADRLSAAGWLATITSYAGDTHLFEGSDLDRAVELDVLLFRKEMR